MNKPVHFFFYMHVDPNIRILAPIADGDDLLSAVLNAASAHTIQLDAGRHRCMILSNVKQFPIDQHDMANVYATMQQVIEHPDMIGLTKVLSLPEEYVHWVIPF